jgi:hypothetical protein
MTAESSVCAPAPALLYVVFNATCLDQLTSRLAPDTGRPVAAVDGRRSPQHTTSAAAEAAVAASIAPAASCIVTVMPLCAAAAALLRWWHGMPPSLTTLLAGQACFLSSHPAAQYAS